MTFVKINNRPVRTFDTIFDELFNGAQAQWTNGQKSGSVPVNIHESKEGYHLEFNAAGRNKEDFKVEVEKGLLTISYEAKDTAAKANETKANETDARANETAPKVDDYKTVRREFSVNSFKRSFNVDDKVNVDNIQAKYENGILKVYLPKKEEIAPVGKQINVQ